jgi:hypothetical protein
MGAMAERETSFALLHHRQPAGDHWDLMLERGDALATWQIWDDPQRLTEVRHPGPLRARRIGDHRRAYLTYEGPLSRNRGEVHRVDAGSYRLIDERPEKWQFLLEGQILRGVFVLLAVPDSEDWHFRRDQ